MQAKWIKLEPAFGMHMDVTNFTVMIWQHPLILALYVCSTSTQHWPISLSAKKIECQYLEG